MDIVEEVIRQKQTLGLEDPEKAYPELKDLLERRMSFDKVREDKYFHDIDTGTVRSRLIAVEHFDNKSREELEIFLFISKESNELDIQIKGKIITHYPTEGWKSTLWYYAYTALYDKFLYGSVRHEYEHAVEEKVEELVERIRQNVEAKY